MQPKSLRRRYPALVNPTHIIPFVVTFLIVLGFVRLGLPIHTTLTSWGLATFGTIVERVDRTKTHSSSNPNQNAQ